MDFGFNDEYKMIQKMYREFAEKEIKPLAEEIDENERFPKESVQKMADNGMLGIPFPEEYGGEEGDYAKMREQFGKPLSAFQNTQFVIANLANQIEAAKLLVYRAAWAKDNHLPYSVESAHAKLYAAETAMRVTTECVQLLGGYGYTREYPVERMMRDAKITQIYEGTSEVQRMVISRSLLR